MRRIRSFESISDVRSSRKASIDISTTDSEARSLVCDGLDESLSDDLQRNLDSDYGKGTFYAEVSSFGRSPNKWGVNVSIIRSASNGFVVLTSVNVNANSNFISVYCGDGAKSRDSELLYEREDSEISSSDIRKISRDVASFLIADNAVNLGRVVHGDVGQMTQNFMNNAEDGIYNKFKSGLLKDIKSVCAKYGSRVTVQNHFVTDREMTRKGRRSDKFTYVVLMTINGGNSDGTEQGDLWGRPNGVQVILKARSLVELEMLVQSPLNRLYVYEGSFYGDTISDLPRGARQFSRISAGIIIEN